MSPKPNEQPAPDMVYVLYLRGVNIGMGYFSAEENQWYDRTTEQPIQPPDEWFPLQKLEK